MGEWEEIHNLQHQRLSSTLLFSLYLSSPQRLLLWYPLGAFMLAINHQFHNPRVWSVQVCGCRQLSFTSQVAKCEFLSKSWNPASPNPNIHPVIGEKGNIIEYLLWKRVKMYWRQSMYCSALPSLANSTMWQAGICFPRFCTGWQSTSPETMMDHMCFRKKKKRIQQQ